MAIVEIRATASHRYYEKRRKSDIIHAIHMMSDQLKIERTPTCELETKTAYELARIAMGLHAQFPE
ncbi:hypothetical protein CcrMagneto_gp218 [Caulobacter virus Magneto]|uniref:hypothetical protein n=1 Tax=Caulobacter virus Magneto TaxID=1211642 RepID=UPI00028BAFE8|nr:hypothetical protein CcrMagneto_gp218 [Caulobacter virus Magneto]AFU87388.1 hypothetical protein CcrMagneto_gp218 [Caulobacter virus Magneto]